MANTDNPCGFKLLSAYNPNWMQFFPLVTTYATAVFKRDVIGEGTTTGLVCKALDGDTRPNVEVTLTDYIFGVCQGTYDSDLLPTVYYVASAAGDGVVAGYVLVNCDPMALYLAQEDGAGDTIAAAETMYCVDAISTHTGNTTSGIGKMELDSDTAAAADATLAFRIIRSWPGDTVASAYCRWVVQPNASVFGGNLVGS